MREKRDARKSYKETQLLHLSPSEAQSVFVLLRGHKKKKEEEEEAETEASVALRLPLETSS